MRTKIIGLIIFLVLLFSNPQLPRNRLKSKPNVIIILVDDLGWTDLGCMGSPLYETPNIDRMVSEGVIFTNAYAASCVCSPTRAAILTGKYPARLHVTDWIPGYNYPYAKLKSPEWQKYLHTDEVTIAEELKKTGYAAASIGKWHLGPAPYYPTRQGFDINIAGSAVGGLRSYFAPYQIENITENKNRENEYLTDRLTEEAIRFIEKNRKNRFFLYLSYYSVHTPIQPKDMKAVDRFEAKVKFFFKHRNPKYAAMIENLDRNVGRLLKRLHEWGIDRDCLIIFTSDNGGHFKYRVTSNCPLRGGKGSPYEGGHRVPLAIKWPSVISAGTVSHEPVSSIDFFPTILEACGVRTERCREDSGIDGVSLVPLLEGSKKKLERKEIFWHYPHYHIGGATPYGAIRSGKWKLIEFYETQNVELYNLGVDISENVDLSRKFPQIADEMQRKLHLWLRNCNAQMPAKNPDFDPEDAHIKASNKKIK